MDFLLAQQSASPEASSDIAQQAIDALQDFEGNVFSIGFGNTLILAGVVALVTFIIITLMRRHLKKHMSGNLKIFYRLIYIVIIVIAVFSVISTIKPLNDLSVAILAGSGVIAVVLGLAAQQTLGNVISGISISVSKPFIIGEYIEILNTSPAIAGIVKDIGLRHTTIRDISNKNVVVPNSILDKEMLRVTHATDSQYVNNFLDVSISYDSDLDLAMGLLADLAAGHKNTLDTRTEEEKKNGVPTVPVKVLDLGASAIVLRAFVWTKDAATGTSTLYDLRYAVKKEFDAKGIEIPYPYQNVILRNQQVSEPGEKNAGDSEKQSYSS